MVKMMKMEMKKEMLSTLFLNHVIKKEKKVGSKAKWSQQMLDDTVDIIISSN